MLLKHSAAAALLLFAVPLFAYSDLGNDSFVSGYAVLGDHAYFVAAKAWSSPNVWRTDGTAAGTVQVTDAYGADAVRHVVALDGKLIYFVRTGGTMYVAASDGTPGGNRHVYPLGEAGVTQVLVHRGAVYFASGASLWRTDGTPDGTRIVRTFDQRVDELAAAGTNVFVFADGELWVSDGTTEGTTSLLRQVWYSDVFVTVVGDLLLFRGLVGNLWRTDGTAQGTSFLAAVNPVRAVVAGGVAWLEITSFEWPPRGRLLRTDGTIAGTSYLDAGFEPVLLTAAGGRVVVVGRWEVWTSDGTEAGSERFRIENLGAYFWAWPAGDVAYFGDSGTFFRTDGTAAGTSQIASFVVQPQSFATLGRKILFSADDGLTGREPWVLDQDTLTARIVANLHPEGSISGRVLASGRTVPTVWITAEHPGYTNGWGMQTEPDGSYRFEGLATGTYRVSAGVWYSEYVPREWPERISIRPGLNVTGIDIEVPRGGKVTGRITGTDGRPVSGIEVCAGPRYGTCTTSAFSQADGTYETQRQLEPGELHVVYTTGENGWSGVLHGGVSCARGCTSESHGLYVQPDEGETVRVDFVVRRWGRLHGRLIDALTGELIPWAATIEAGPQRTGAHGGHFALDLRDGTWPITARSVYYEPWVSPEPVSLVAGTTRRGYEVIMTPSAGRVRGRILDAATGAPASGIIVRVFGAAGNELATLSTRSDGTYSSAPQLTPGSYTLVADGNPAAIPFTISGNSIFTAPDLAVEIIEEP